MVSMLSVRFAGTPLATDPDHAAGLPTFLRGGAFRARRLELADEVGVKAKAEKHAIFFDGLPLTPQGVCSGNCCLLHSGKRAPVFSLAARGRGWWMSMPLLEQYPVRTAARRAWMGPTRFDGSVRSETSWIRPTRGHCSPAVARCPTCSPTTSLRMKGGHGDQFRVQDIAAPVRDIDVRVLPWQVPRDNALQGDNKSLSRTSPRGVEVAQRTDTLVRSRIWWGYQADRREKREQPGEDEVNVVVRRHRAAGRTTLV